MAGVSECFNIGSVVACKTCYEKEIEGEVLAFDPQTKMLILKCPASSGRPSRNDVHMVNLSMVSDVQVKREATAPLEPPQSLNLQRLNTRVRNQIEEKKRLVTALAAGVSPEGQKLFLTITKTINEATWQGPNIVVWNTVTISPPYTAENVKGATDSKAYLHIRKVVEKHTKDMAAAEASSRLSGASSPIAQQQTSSSPGPVTSTQPTLQQQAATN
ncbi:protein LSM12 [Frankliniella occidentalis]|uniref:Protein LSM12 n=1 Tax=Frankliniella occidentalis TaxID=133901 RepID=A0A6J1TKK1_FRAOC|nr:protein LSM12 [Frankliniella occidentalis]